ncbi:hypothetical protein EVAR_35974_1 [Eumeta japonica]|uniref:Uncharacterized protein n=1 Tax=Eumeta variegata TaxID=151549 RepID=A0A4C1W6E6_EUMVA|nr:hypothetical protein EVAR_35974_1 [Eumeta japonica]
MDNRQEKSKLLDRIQEMVIFEKTRSIDIPKRFSSIENEPPFSRNFGGVRHQRDEGRPDCVRQLCGLIKEKEHFYISLVILDPTSNHKFVPTCSNSATPNLASNNAIIVALDVLSDLLLRADLDPRTLQELYTRQTAPHLATSKIIYMFPFCQTFDASSSSL